MDNRWTEDPCKWVEDKRRMGGGFIEKERMDGERMYRQIDG